MTLEQGSGCSSCISQPYVLSLLAARAGTTEAIANGPFFLSQAQGSQIPDSILRLMFHHLFDLINNITIQISLC